MNANPKTQTTIHHRSYCPNCCGAGRITVGLVTFRCQRCLRH